ncbi:hypothetical protein PstZobell_01302 [Stutzerimonas stutzeri ATCC 14405 = CCUG 16156]|uniref:DUF262 domain-containing protein n=1 Tax=Stutzerimonas stutzeri TaxID=316 RepID=UPI00025497D5|nr:DUF262 domain-containing protein [Stutzerimonas stutzeri]EHY76059.1 hypothetical protein PstZobell_01302 [Stutzerimonas stutzeri ATCC 14405 = CCUG 16156]QOZ94855.1 DUF262 domain-containing protein [Stutzerimonas stutzeri]
MTKETKMSISSPQPSVLHLVTIFRQISSGDIRIPAFQREFVWKEKQILDLLDSVTDGYPVGSLLLWAVDTQLLKIAPSDSTAFPNVEEHYPTSYVLDGMQRLSSLYGVFHFSQTTQDSRFDVVYDLVENRFLHRVDVIEESAVHVPLSAIFKPRLLLEQQSKISKLESADELIEKLLVLQAAFQEYMIPVVTIRGVDIHRIVGIFERINSTGTRLDPVDFMRAITWAENFDLNKYLEESVSQLSQHGLDLEPETVIKCVGLVLNTPPTTEGLLGLRNFTPAELAEAFEITVGNLAVISRFLEQSFRIYSSHLIPYEGQLLLLFKAITLEGAGSEDVDLLIKWYWAAGFNESLRGKPDHYVVRALENWKGLVRGEIRGLEPRLKLSAMDLYERRLLSGKALSTTFAMMFAANNAACIRIGSAIEPAKYMTSDFTECFNAIFSLAELAEAGLKQAVSAKFFSNLVLIDRALPRQTSKEIRESILTLYRGQRWDVLESQFISHEAAEALSNNDIELFFLLRGRDLHDGAARMVGSEQ